jgi:hypothetical protein
MGKAQKTVRRYRLSDAALLQLADSVVTIATRDSAVLASRGVTPARLSDLAAMNDTFRHMEDDTEWKGLVAEKTELKNAARDRCRAGTAELRRMASNVFGERSGTYRRFGFENINRLSDIYRIRAYFRVWRRADEHAAALIPEGLTPEVLAEFRTACQLYDAAYDEMDDTAMDRDIAAEQRIELGNRIYAEVVRICNTGKTYWETRSVARYKDYLVTAGRFTD